MILMKNLEYYLKIPYLVEITEINEEEGGGFLASIPLLGKYAFLGEGRTVEEALANLEKTKRYLFQKYLKQGIPIPV